MLSDHAPIMKFNIISICLYNFLADRKSILIRSRKPYNHWLDQRVEMTTLRDLTENDLDDLLRRRNDPEVNRYLTTRVKTKADAEAWFTRIKSDPRNFLKGILQDGRLVGYCIVEDVDEQNR